MLLLPIVAMYARHTGAFPPPNQSGSDQIERVGDERIDPLPPVDSSSSCGEDEFRALMSTQLAAWGEDEYIEAFRLDSASAPDGSQAAFGSAVWTPSTEGDGYSVTFGPPSRSIETLELLIAVNPAYLCRLSTCGGECDPPSIPDWTRRQEDPIEWNTSDEIRVLSVRHLKRAATCEWGVTETILDLFGGGEGPSEQVPADWIWIHAGAGFCYAIDMQYYPTLVAACPSVTDSGTGSISANYVSALPSMNAGTGAKLVAIQSIYAKARQYRENRVCTHGTWYPTEDTTSADAHAKNNVLLLDHVATGEIDTVTASGLNCYYVKPGDSLTFRFFHQDLDYLVRNLCALMDCHDSC